MTREEFVKDLSKTLCLNYDMPEEFAIGLAEFLYDEDYRKIDTSDNQKSSCTYKPIDNRTKKY